MPKTYPAKNDFTRGKFTPLLEDRSDERIFQNGARELQNVFVLPHGGVTRRGGTRYAGKTRFSTGGVHLEGFTFSENPKQSYVLEFGDKYLRFLWGYNKVPIIDPASLDPALKWAFVGTGLNDVTVSGSYTGTVNHYYKIAIISTDDGKDVINFYIDGVASTSINLGEVTVPYTITLSGISYTIAADNGHTIGDYWETEVYWPLMLRTPWPESIVKELQNGIIQREDVAFIAHRNYVPQKLSRYGHTDWRLEPWLPTKAPWQPSIGLKYTLYDASAIHDSKNIPSTSKGNLDYYFDEANGAVELKSDDLDSTIAFSLDSTYYSTAANAFRVDLLAAIGSVSWPSIEITGTIYIPSDGDYQFSLNSGKGGADLFIDGTVAASRYGTNNTPDIALAAGFQTTLAGRAKTTTLTKGAHTIRARCFLANANRTLAVYWKKPGDSSFTTIPPQYFVEQTERYGVSCAEYTAYDIANSVTLPPTNQAAFDSLFTTDTSGVTVNRTGHWDDRISFHSQVGMTENPFTADLPPDCLTDNTSHSLEISGYLTISEDGSYQFAVDGNDGCEFVLYDSTGNVLASVVWLSNINTQAQADGFTEFKSSSWAKHASSAVSLTSGVYPFRARYWSQLKGFAFSCAWLTPGETDFVAIPQSAITPNAGYYPRCLTFHEQRIFVGGSIEEPQRIYASKSFDFDDFTTGAEADDGLEFRIASEQVDPIQWMVSKDVLYAGTLSTEYIIQGSNGVLVPDDIQVKPNTSYGSAYIRPVKAEDAIYFVDRSERGLREYSYVLERDKSVGVNVGILAEDLFHKGIQRLVYQQGGNAAFRFGLDDIDEYLRLHSKLIADPINAPRALNLLWALTSDGELKSLTIEMLEKVYAWTEHVLGGSAVVVDSMAVIPGDGGDLLFLAVSRTINSATVRTLEWIDPLLLCDLGNVEYTIGGNSGMGGISLPHIPSETIRAVGLDIDAAGAVVWEPIYDHAGLTYDLTLDSSGVIDFKSVWWTAEGQDAYNKYQAIFSGYPFYCLIETLPFDVQIAQSMTSLGMMKRWIDLWLSVVYAPQALLSSAVDTTTTESMEDAGTLTTGRQRYFILGWDREAALRVTQDHPTPMTLRSIYGELQVNIG